jgi:hypothetical protein
MTQGVVKRVGDHFEVSGKHTYSRVGNYSLRITVTAPNRTAGVARETVHVADAPLTAWGKPFHATAGKSFTGVVATFRDANPKGKLAEFTATIDWGNGKKTMGVLTRRADGKFEVRGTNTYAKAGRYTVVVKVASTGGSKAMATFQVVVGK